jgi:uncharacterized damage-inducible protein DinB
LTEERQFFENRRGQEVNVNGPFAGMLRYNKWATLKLIEACSGLPDSVLDAQPPGVSGKVRVLLMHLVGGQQTFVLRTQGKQHINELSRGSAWPGFETLTQFAIESSDQLVAIAQGLDRDVDVDVPYRGKVYRYPRSFFLVHAVEHGVEHRTEIKVALKQLGIDTPDLDGWPYSVDAGYGEEVQTQEATS